MTKGNGGQKTGAKTLKQKNNIKEKYD